MKNDWYKRKKRRKALKVVLIVLIILAVLTGIVSAVLLSGIVRFSFSRGKSSTGNDLPEDFQKFFDSYFTITKTDETKVYIEKYSGEIDFEIEFETKQTDELTLQKLYETCSPSIVSIIASEDDKDNSAWGSGVIVSADGIVITNTHVLEDSNEATVQLYDDTKYEAKLISADAASDIALLKIEPDKELTYAKFADSSGIQVGDKVAAIGNPLGETFRNTLTNGIISAIERDIIHNGHTMTLLQTNTALNGGNSGGGLFDMYGRVIGITNMKMVSVSSSIEGIAFSIPSTIVKDIVHELVTNGYVQRSTIGVVLGSIPNNVSKYYDIPSGLYVNEVYEGSGAEKAGIKPGDIITKANGQDVSLTTDVSIMKDSLKPGDTMTFTIFRDNEYFDVVVVLQEDVINKP